MAKERPDRLTALLYPWASDRRQWDSGGVAELRTRFLDLVLSNANNQTILERAGNLDLPDWWLTAGAVFQTVWNVLDQRPADAGIQDYDLLYFDPKDLSAESETNVNRHAAALFADLDILVEARNEARVHLWYEEEFGVPGKRSESSRDAVDHFAATTCCFAVRLGGDESAPLRTARRGVVRPLWH